MLKWTVDLITKPAVDWTTYYLEVESLSPESHFPAPPQPQPLYQPQGHHGPLFRTKLLNISKEMFSVFTTGVQYTVIRDNCVQRFCKWPANTVLKAVGKCLIIIISWLIRRKVPYLKRCITLHRTRINGSVHEILIIKKINGSLQKVYNLAKYKD
jgi:hypothetical protein